MRTEQPCGSGRRSSEPEEPRGPENGKKPRSVFKLPLKIILLLGLGIELLLRPFLPELVKGESALGDIVRLVLAVFGLGLDY